MPQVLEHISAGSFQEWYLGAQILTSGRIGAHVDIVWRWMELVVDIKLEISEHGTFWGRERITGVPMNNIDQEEITINKDEEQARH